VVLEVRVKVPLSAANLAPELPRLPEMVAALGPEITFSKQEVRNFVAEVEVADIIKQIESQLLSSLAPYLSHPEFAGRFIRKAYKEFLEKSRWYKVMKGGGGTQPPTLPSPP
jgi:hypothetical protein